MIQVLAAQYANSQHRQAIVDLLNSYACDPMGGASPLSEYVKTHLVPELEKRPNLHVFLAFRDTQPIGLLISIESFSSFACKTVLNIHDIVVLPSFRGQGIGKQLLHAAEAYARQIDCCKLTLEVLEGNYVAQKLYQSIGYRFYELDVRTGKAMFMEKKLLKT